MMRTLTLLALAGLVAAQAPLPPAPKLGVVVFEDDSAGVVVEEVREGSVAAKAGLAPGDRIVKLGDIVVKEDEDLVKALSAVRAGRTTDVEVVRQGERKKIPLTFAPPSAPEVPKVDPIAEARAAIARAKKALAGVKDEGSGAVRKALDELSKAEKALAKSGGPAITGGGPPGMDKVFKRVEQLMGQGATPQEIEETIAEEFPGVRIKIGGEAPGSD